MRVTTFRWLDREFVRVEGQGTPGLAVADATRELLDRARTQLARYDLTLDQTMRTRLFARDKAGRDAASAARREVFSGQARMVSSGLVAPLAIDSDANIAMDILLMRPRGAGLVKTLQEYDPPRTPLRYLTYDGLLFTSGETVDGPDLGAQVAQIMADHGESLAMAGTSWERVAQISCFLHSSQDVASLRRALADAAPVERVPLEWEYVEGYAGAGRLAEIEVVAAV
jgi:enamine deaminase RidA (YjgF/YER057c/UK114 family)